MHKVLLLSSLQSFHKFVQWASGGLKRIKPSDQLLADGKFALALNPFMH